jgi:hypothetical protein
MTVRASIGHSEPARNEDIDRTLRERGERLIPGDPPAGGPSSAMPGDAKIARLDEALWVAAAPLSFLGLHLGTRMTVVRLAGGELWVHSPIATTPEMRAAVDALGPVRHIVAPSLFHHLYAGQWQTAYPDAALYGPAALARKRKDLKLTSPLEEAARAPWAGELVPLHIDGCQLDETVFVHHATRTLIASDITENFTTSPHWPTRLYLKMSGVHGKVGWSRLLRFVYRDRAAARRSVDALIEHDFDRVVIAHGDVIPAGGKDALRTTFEFLG